MRSCSDSFTFGAKPKLDKGSHSVFGICISIEWASLVILDNNNRRAKPSRKGSRMAGWGGWRAGRQHAARLNEFDPSHMFGGGCQISSDHGGLPANFVEHCLAKLFKLCSNIHTTSENQVCSQKGHKKDPFLVLLKTKFAHCSNMSVQRSWGVYKQIRP